MIFQGAVRRACYTVVPTGEVVHPEPGDFILCHRKGLASSAIRLGERLRFRSGHRWSHCAYYPGDGVLIQAVTAGVSATPLEEYRHVEYLIVHTFLGDDDTTQATAYARACVGQPYSWGAILGVVLWAITPGGAFAFSCNRAQICSGLVASTQVRGWAIFPVDTSIMTPAGLAEYYGVPDRPV